MFQTDFRLIKNKKTSIVSALMQSHSLICICVVLINWGTSRNHVLW